MFHLEWQRVVCGCRGREESEEMTGGLEIEKSRWMPCRVKRVSSRILGGEIERRSEGLAGFSLKVGSKRFLQSEHFDLRTSCSSADPWLRTQPDPVQTNKTNHESHCQMNPIRGFKEIHNPLWNVDPHAEQIGRWCISMPEHWRQSAQAQHLPTHTARQHMCGVWTIS